MKSLKSLLQHETALPLAALGFATAVSVSLVAARVGITHRLQYTLLVWNLFLAWLPLGFALLAREAFKRSRPGSFVGLGVAWLLFFPNAPYIFTDLVHVRQTHFHYWLDLALVLLSALTGLVLGFVSLYLMQ